MINTVVSLALQHRMIVICAIVAVLTFGIYFAFHLPIDAFPDISPIMVPIFAEAHGMAPEEIERLITFPIESAMNGLPGVTQIKSTSAFGMAVIYVYFTDATDIYFARQIVSERLSSAVAELPQLHEPPKLGPISTGLGQIFIYYLTLDEDVPTGGKDRNTYLREINDWVVKFQLQTVPGVTDILSIGGHVLQYQLKINPYALNKYRIALDEVITAVRANNRNAGGQFIVLSSEEYLVRGIGLVQTLEHLKNIQIKTVDGIPITISDIATVAYGNELRRGVVTRNGTSEVVSGIVLQLFGENTSNVIKRLYEKVPEVQASLPQGIQLIPYYEQAELVTKATDTVKNALFQGGLLVLLTLLVFLGNVRTAFIVALSLPFCVLIAVICMRYTGLSANLMSLGGIAIGIGMLGDGSIVMVENIFRHLSQHVDGKCPRMETILAAAKQVSRPIVFSIAIIIIVFLPLFTLQGVEGKMFSPMAFTISFALLGSIIAALVMAPALSMYLLREGQSGEVFLLRVLKSSYQPLLRVAMRFKVVLVLVALVVFGVSLALIPSLGTEFIPTLEEGSILIGAAMAPSISLTKATETIMKLEKEIVKFDEVEQTISRIGRPEAGSHPHPVNYAEIHIDLKPMEDWQRFTTKNELIEAINQAISDYPGVQFNFTQPIQNAFDELLSGIKAQLAIKLYGENLTLLREKATEIRNAIDLVPGLVDVAVEQSFGQPQLQIVADRAACARYGVHVADLLELVELAIGGEVIDQIYLQTRRFGIQIRYDEPYRQDPEVIKNLLVQTGEGSLVPLSQVAEVKQVVGPIQINRDKNQRRWVIQANIRNRDLGSVVSDIKEIIKKQITIPPGYFIEFGGQFENQERALKRLSIIVPVALSLIFFMLYATFNSLRNAFLIMINVPLALIGGVLGLYISGDYLSVPATIGFIALFGIAVQNGVVLVSYIKQLREQGYALEQAVLEGCMLRIRPVLMTACTTVLGLIPLFLARGIGAEVQRPLATVVIFGLISSTILTLFILPSLYSWFEDKKEC